MAGMYLVLFPRHDIHMAFWFRPAWWFPPWIKTFPLTGIYAVVGFMVYEAITVALGPTGNVAHGVHAAGYIAGALTGIVLLLTGLVDARGYDLLTWIMGKRWRRILLRKPKSLGSVNPNR